MNEKPHVEPLPYNRRRSVFLLLVISFIIAMPIFVFYATGYRYDFFSQSPSITATGGIYLSAEAEDHVIYVDEELVDNLRVFRNASYIQGLQPGIHRVHVQGDGLQTWVKELPVYPHIVTEVDAFNIPEVPQLRPITPTLINGFPVHIGSTTTKPFKNASITVPFLLHATSSESHVENVEYEFISQLFSTSTATTTSIVQRFIGRVNDAFEFSSDNTEATTSTTTVLSSDMQLYEKEDGLFASWQGETDSIPYYFCIPHQPASTTSAYYGEHVLQGIATVLEATTESEILRNTDTTGVCRSEIQIDTQNQTFHWFAFHPDSSDHVLLLLESGLYVVEIDDRSWQNSQILYPGNDLHVAIDGGRIFIDEKGNIAELFIELQN